jgi:ADP-heptose:LPS heptosyltransferase
LLLGDTLMLTPLLAKLRQQYPGSQIIMTVPPATAPVYQKRPYGVQAFPYDPRDRQMLRTLMDIGGFDLAIVPGDNRFSWLARALDSRWIVAFAGDRPPYKSWPVDEQIPYPEAPAAWGDMVAELVDGDPPAAYTADQWSAPDYTPFALPGRPYCVFHVGARTTLKLWPADHWRRLARSLTERGYQVVWSGGPGEERHVRRVDPGREYLSYAGRLDLPQLWQLLAKSRLLVCPDTSVAHLGRIIGTPTVALFGPGSPVLCGAGTFWRNSKYAAVTVGDIPCRDQHGVFKRNIDWVKLCSRTPDECPRHICMETITMETVAAAADRFLKQDPAAIYQ